MKNKIKLVVLIAFAGLLTFGVESCKKYPEGPTISLRSRKERVANTWKVDNYKINGTDFTSLVADYTETYTKDGNYSYKWGILDGTGTWSFQNNDEEIKLTGTSGTQSSHTLIIQKLEEKVFWYYYMDGNDKVEFHMIEN